jgi:hypothetical protein
MHQPSSGLLFQKIIMKFYGSFIQTAEICIGTMQFDHNRAIELHEGSNACPVRSFDNLKAFLSYMPI